MYIEKKLIKEITPKAVGNGIHLDVTFEDGSVETYTKWEYDTIVSETDTLDQGDIRNRIVTKISSAVLELLLSMDVKLEHVDHVFRKVERSLNDNLQDSVDRLFKNSYQERRMSHLDQVLDPQKYAKEEDQEGSSKEGKESLHDEGKDDV